MDNITEGIEPKGFKNCRAEMKGVIFQREH